MKKSILFFTVFSLLLIGLALTSCKSHEKCPAYSKAKTVNFNESKNV